MKVIIAGSRDLSHLSVRLVEREVARSGFQITEVVSGTARGVDRVGELWGRQNKIPVAQFPADWNRYGKKAGYLRNVEMAEYADALIALWDGTSRGTKHMINIATKGGLAVYVYNEKMENAEKGISE